MENQSVQKFEGKDVRTVVEGEQVLFVAKDVAEALEVTWNGSTLGGIPEDFKGMLSVSTPGGKQDLIVLNEAGLNFFVLRSDSPKALPFQRWVSSSVLPSIRKNGAYIAGQDTMDDTQLMAKALLAANRIIESRNKQLTEAKPKIDFYNAVTGNEDKLYSMGETAKILFNQFALGRNDLFKVLRHQKILMNDNKPYQEYIDREWFRVIISNITHGEFSTQVTTTKVTAIGIDGIRKILPPMVNK